PQTRTFMRIHGVKLHQVSVTGFEVYLTATPDAALDRDDKSFVGTIALFRHDGPISISDGNMADIGHGAAGEPSDTVNVTAALQAAGVVDPTKLHVVIRPFSLVQVRNNKAELVDTGALQFDSIGFFTQTI